MVFLIQGVDVAVTFTLVELFLIETAGFGTKRLHKHCTGKSSWPNEVCPQFFRVYR